MLLAAFALAFLPQESAHVTLPFIRLHRAAYRALGEGRCEEARALFERCLALSPKNATVAYGEACAAACAGEIDRALAALARAVEWGYADAAVLEWDADLASLRPDPRFAEMAARMRATGRARGAQLEFHRISEMLPVPYCTSAALSRDGSRVAVGDSSGLVRLLDGRDGAELARVGPLTSPVWALGFDPQRARVAVLAWDGRAHLLDCETGARAEFEALPRDADDRPFHWLPAERIEFDPTGESLLVAASRRGASLWTAAGELVCRIEPPTADRSSIRTDWSDDGARLAVARDGLVHLIDARTGEADDAPLEAGAEICALDLHPDGRRIATGLETEREGGCLRLFDLETRELLWEQYARLWDPEGEGWPITAVGDVRISDAGEWLAASSRTPGRVAVFDVESGERVWCSDHLDGRVGEPVELRWSPSGERLWFLLGRSVLPLWTIEPRSEPREPVARAQRPSRPSLCHAAFVDSRSVALLDAETGRVRWARPALGRPGWLVQAGTGHFDGDVDVGALGIELAADAGGSRLLGSFADRLHDPKRVRAAQAGVELVRPDLRRGARSAPGER